MKTKPNKNCKPNFSIVTLYMGYEDDEAGRAVVLAVAGYENPADAAREIGISKHEANYYWDCLKRRDALFGGKHYAALTAWAEGD